MIRSFAMLRFDDWTLYSSAIIFHTREKVGIVATIHNTVVQKDKWQELMKNFEELEKLVVSIDLFVILIPSLSFLSIMCYLFRLDR